MHCSHSFEDPILHNMSSNLIQYYTLPCPTPRYAQNADVSVYDDVDCSVSGSMNREKYHQRFNCARDRLGVRAQVTLPTMALSVNSISCQTLITRHLC